MKKFIFSLFLIFTVLFNAAAYDFGKDYWLIKDYEHGRDWIKASNPNAGKELKALFKDYYFLSDLEKNGFNLDDLENLSTPAEIDDYFDKYTRNTDNTPVDNHIAIKSWDYETNTSCRCAGYHSIRTIEYENIFGTKEELEAKGYIENETMFYYPSYWKTYDENRYRVGKLVFSEDKCPVVAENYFKIKTDNNWLYVRVGDFKADYYTDKGPVEKSGFSNIRKEIESSKKENLIIDLRANAGGDGRLYKNLVSSIKKMKPKNIYLLIDTYTASCGETCTRLIEKDLNKKVIRIGSPTFGANTAVKEATIDYGTFGLDIMISNEKGWVSVDRPEGYGEMPNVFTEDDSDAKTYLKTMLNDPNFNAF